MENPSSSRRDFVKTGIMLTGGSILLYELLPLVPFLRYPIKINRANTVKEVFRFPTTIESIVAAETGIKDKEELKKLAKLYAEHLINRKHAYRALEYLRRDFNYRGIAYDQPIEFPDLNNNGRIDKIYPPRTTSSKFPDHPTHPEDIIGQEIFHYFTAGHDYQMKLNAWNDVKSIYEHANSQQDKLQKTLEALTQYDELIKEATTGTYQHDRENLDKYALLAGFAAASYFNSKNPNDFSLGLNENQQQDIAWKIQSATSATNSNSWASPNKELATSLMYLSELVERQAGVVSGILTFHYGLEDWEKRYVDEGRDRLIEWTELYPKRMLNQINDGMPPELLIPATIAFWQHYKEFKEAHMK